MAKINFSSSIDLLKYPITTAKTISLLENNQYTFLVDPKLTKPNIKKAIEFLFDVKVIKINSCNIPRKKRRVQQFVGSKPRYKKVMFKLAKGDKIDFFSDDKDN